MLLSCLPSLLPLGFDNSIDKYENDDESIPVELIVNNFDDEFAAVARPPETVWNCKMLELTTRAKI